MQDEDRVAIAINDQQSVVVILWPVAYGVYCYTLAPCHLIQY